MNEANVYRVESVEPCNPPRGVARGEWHRYVVASARSRIIGRCRGSLSKARQDAEHFANGLNLRVRNGGSMWAPRSRKRAR